MKVLTEHAGKDDGGEVRDAGSTSVRSATSAPGK